MKTIRKILVPTDLSELSLAGLDCAHKLVSHRGAQIYLLHVLARQTMPTPTAESALGKFGAACEHSLNSELEQFLTEQTKRYENIVCIVRRGEAWREIVRYAREEKIDLIVIATHGRTGLAHVLMGSVAEKVVRHSTVPVLTVKPQLIREALLKEDDIEE
ncbi:MAG: universal stress protein [Bacteroidetes bacterium]|nr:universal stress protein [Bacteroidota bacterium]